MITHCCCLFQLESSTLNWFEAQQQCRERGGLTIQRNKSDQSYWTGRYRRITPWIKIKGLYHYLIIILSERFSQPDHFKLIVVALIWLKYCRYGVKIYPINQSINKTLYGIWDNSPDILINCCTYTAGHGWDKLFEKKTEFGPSAPSCFCYKN